MNTLHNTYGGVVRIGPRSISIAGKDMIKQVLVNDDLPKGPIYSLFKSRKYACTWFKPTLLNASI